MVTGALGFIGSHVVDAIADECEVIALDNQVAGANYATERSKVVIADIRDNRLVREELHGVDTIIHLAARTSVVDSVIDPDKTFETNVVGTYWLLREAARAGVKRFVNASTAGALMGVGMARETAPPCPQSPYGASKLAAEAYCNVFKTVGGLSCVSLRFSNVYGPRTSHKPSLVTQAMKSALAGRPLTIYGDGSQERDYVFVSDVVRAIRLACNSDFEGVCNVATGKRTTVNEIVGAVAIAVGKSLPVIFQPPRPGEIERTWCDVERAWQVLGFVSEVSIADGINKTWEWYSKA